MQPSNPTHVARALGAAVRPILPATTLCRATLAATLFACISGGNAVRAQDQFWIEQYGSNMWERSSSATADGAGGVFASGTTGGNFGGPHVGAIDAWVGRFDGAGHLLWSRLVGTVEGDAITSSAPDASGGVYVAGSTDGDLGGPPAGQGDGWIARYDGSGNQLWVRQFGDIFAEVVLATAPDGSGGAFVGGRTANQFGGQGSPYNDVFIVRYDAAGNQLWTQTMGTADFDTLNAAASDGSGGVFVSGYSGGSLGGPSAGVGDAWIARYDGAGNQLWIRQFGTRAHDESTTLSPDGAGGVLAGGTTQGDLAGLVGSRDAWVARYDAAGTQLWLRQFGTFTLDELYHSAPDGSGGCFVGGQTLGSLGGPVKGVEDAWLGRFASDGALLWLKQLGTSTDDHSFGSAYDGAGGVFLLGHTGGVLGASSFGGPDDVFLARFGECLPGTSYCTALTTSGGCLPFVGSVGVPSLSAPGSFQVMANALQPGTFGLVFFGTTGASSTPFFGGTLCVASPLYRLQAANTGGSAACSGQLVYSLASLLAHPTGGPLLTAGTQVHCQAWFRDPPAAQAVGLSDGLRFTVCP
jgi:hypothetical protein